MAILSLCTLCPVAMWCAKTGFRMCVVMLASTLGQLISFVCAYLQWLMAVGVSSVHFAFVETERWVLYTLLWFTLHFILIIKASLQIAVVGGSCLFVSRIRMCACRCWCELTMSPRSTCVFEWLVQPTNRFYLVVYDKTIYWNFCLLGLVIYSHVTICYLFAKK